MVAGLTDHGPLDTAPPADISKVTLCYLGEPPRGGTPMFWLVLTVNLIEVELPGKGTSVVVFQDQTHLWACLS